MSDKNNLEEKILIRYYSQVLEEIVVETFWAEIIDKNKGLYKVDNIPFYGPELSFGDIIFAEFDNDEERITFRKVVEHSGNSTIQVVVLDDSFIVEKLREDLSNLGCDSEKIGEKYFVIDVPYNLNYLPIFNKLNELESAEIISFAEPNISEKHISEKQ